MLKEMVSPPAIVAKAEAVNEGIAKLAKQIGAHYQEQRTSQDRADMCGLEIGRLICEHAASAEVKGKLAVINAKAEGGRPKSAHCYVAEQIALSGIAGTVSQRHMERCARAFQKAQKKGLPLNTPIRVAEASAVIQKVSEKPLDEMQPSPERLFETETTEEPKERYEPEREAAELAKKIRTFFFTSEGHPRLRSKDQRRKFFEALNKGLEQLEIPGAFVPNESK